MAIDGRNGLRELLLSAAALALWAAHSFAADAVQYGKPQLVAKLAHPSIHESSGLGCSRLRKDLFWTHNDSGDRARFFAFDAKGARVAQLLLPVRARDWEDMASFTMGKRAYLLAADVGNNNLRRKHVTLHIVREPGLAVGKREQKIKLDAAKVLTVDFKLEGGPQNCEAVAVDVVGRMIYLVSKTDLRASQVYQLALPTKALGKVLTAKQLVKVPVRMATGMDISPDGRRCVILTYTLAAEYARRGDETWKAAFSRPPRELVMPARKQGESICYGPDGVTLYLTSEGRPTPLWKVSERPGQAEK
jgi:hypothetical protein